MASQAYWGSKGYKNYLPNQELRWNGNIRQIKNGKPTAFHPKNTEIKAPSGETIQE